MLTINRSNDKFDSSKINLAERWAGFLLDRRIDNSTNGVAINGRQVNIWFVKVTDADTIPDGNYNMVYVPGDRNSAEAHSDDMIYIVKFHDLIRPHERFSKNRYCFDQYIKACNMFSCELNRFIGHVGHNRIALINASIISPHSVASGTLFI